VGDFPQQKNGFLPLPEGTGLGIAIDADWVSQNPWNDVGIWASTPGAITPRHQVA
jgi:hypothetical protein